MTTKIPRHGAVVSIDNPTNPIDISSTIAGATIAPEKREGEVFTADSLFGQVVHGGGRKCVVTLRVIRTTGTTEGYNIFDDWYHDTTPESRTLTVDHPNSNAGSKRLTGEFSLTTWRSADRESGSGDAEIHEAVLTSDGQYTHVTI